MGHWLELGAVTGEVGDDRGSGLCVRLTHFDFTLGVVGHFKDFYGGLRSGPEKPGC